MNGIIIVDKPSGWTSHDIVAKLRSTLHIKRIGHGGTLDPIATGVLPVFLGRATRAVRFFESADKEYVAGLKLGIVSDTQDITGNVLSSGDAKVDADSLRLVIPRFLGTQKQVPPMYSAVKIGGKKLYELARRGVEIERPPRDIVVHEIEILSSPTVFGGIDTDDCGGSAVCDDDSASDEFLLRVSCSKGTYIRTLCNDIGEALGCGGVMSSLRRTQAGIFGIKDAHTLDSILESASSGSIDSFIVPVDSLFATYPSITLNEETARKCRNGTACQLSGSADGVYRFYSPHNEFLFLGELNSGVSKIIKTFFEAPR